jgi:hypothetical protein
MSGDPSAACAKINDSFSVQVGTGNAGPLAPLPDPARVKWTVFQVTAKLQHDDLSAAWSPAHSAYMRGHLDGWHEGFRAAIATEALSPKPEAR